MNFVKDLQSICNHIIIENVYKLSNDHIAYRFLTRNINILNFIFNKQFVINDNFAIDILTGHELDLNLIVNDNNSLPLLPNYISPPYLFNQELFDSLSDDLKSIDFSSYQTDLITFLKQNRVTVRATNKIHVDDLHTLQSIFTIKNKQLNDKDDSYKIVYSFHTIKKEIDRFHNEVDSFIGIKAVNNHERINNLKSFILKKINEQIPIAAAKLIEEKEISLKSLSRDEYEIVRDDIESHYASELHFLKNTDYAKMLEYYKDIVELMLFWPSWLEIPKELSIYRHYDNSILKLNCVLAKLGFKSIDQPILDILKDKLTQQIKKRKTELLDEIKECSTDTTITSDLSILADNINKIDVDNFYNKDVNIFKLFFMWPEHLSPPSKEMLVAQNIINNNSQIVYI
jgi:hypothetical protein